MLCATHDLKEIGRGTEKGKKRGKGLKEEKKNICSTRSASICQIERMNTGMKTKTKILSAELNFPDTEVV